MFNEEYDIIVVGAGHAGSEAAAAAANMGSKTLLITMNLQNIAQMSCNPAMGGIAKGQIIKEIDALEAKAYGQKECFEAGVNFARTEGIVPAPEATHAVKGAIDAALECKKNGESKTILFNLCGHGHFDMKAYGDYFEGNLAEDKFDKGSMDKALEDLPKIA